MKLSKADILFLCQYFYPDQNSSSTLPFDTAVSMGERGYKVSVLCGMPKEYSDHKNVLTHEHIEGVEIHRLRYLQMNRKRVIGRLINFSSFTVSALLHVGEIGRSKCIIVYSNPPVLPLVALCARRVFGNKLVFVSYDVYPEIACLSGVTKENSLLARSMRAVNKSLFHNCDAVVTLTDEMADYLLCNRQGIKREKVFVIPNWAHEATAKSDEETYRKLAIRPGQFVVTFLGNLGVCQEIDTILETIISLKEHQEIVFLIAGHGVKMEEVRKKTEGYANVRLLKYITGNEFEKIADVGCCGIVSLIPGLKGTCAPSKYYTYLQAGQPVIALVDEDSYLSNELKKYNAGLYIEHGNSEKLSKTILYMQQNPNEWKKMSENARRLYQNNYSKTLAMNRYTNLFNYVLME